MDSLPLVNNSHISHYSSFYIHYFSRQTSLSQEILEKASIIMAQAGDEATAPPSTTPAGSPPRSVLVEHLERQLYGIVDRTPGATTTLPRTPPIISDDNTEPSTTSPCTLRRFSTGQDTKGKDRANPVDSAVGDAAASSSGGVEETPRYV